jgi:hypothetical protein
MKNISMGFLTLLASYLFTKAKSVVPQIQVHGAGEV